MIYSDGSFSESSYNFDNRDYLIGISETEEIATKLQLNYYDSHVWLVALVILGFVGVLCGGAMLMAVLLIAYDFDRCMCNNINWCPECNCVCKIVNCCLINRT